MLKVPRHTPETDGFRGETSVGEYDNKRSPFSQNTTGLAEYLAGMDDILDADNTDGCIELAVPERKHWAPVEIVHDELVQLGILFHLSPVHPEPHDVSSRFSLRQVGTPAAHKIQDSSPDWQGLLEQDANGVDRCRVNVGAQSWNRIEQGIILGIFPVKGLRR